jgi:hypothetical protein
MRTNVPEKLLKIVEEIDARGDANLTRLAVLKKWFERPGRLSAFGVWAAARASSRKGKSGGVAGQLVADARAMLAGADTVHPTLDRQAAQNLHDRLREFQNEYQNQRWGPVRIIRHWNLLLIEEGLSIYLGYEGTPAQGYKLAADYCQHYDSRHGNGLNGPSRTKLLEIVRFMATIEAEEERTERVSSKHP